MLRDLRIFRRNSEKSPHTNSEKSPHTGVNNENVDPSDSSAAHLDLDSSRAPLNTIQETSLNPRLPADQELVPRIRIERTPSKNGRAKGSDALLRTPDKPGVAVATRNRFGWGTKNESGTNAAESGDEAGHYGASHLPPGGRGATLGAGGVLGITTPRAYHTAGKASYAHSEGSSTQSTPTKSVNKPPNPGLGGPRHFLATGARMGTFSSASRGMPISSSSIVNTVEVSHFELREDPSFWMDHNVQVVIRVRPLNTTERSLQGYNRCLKQESAQSISWIGQPEARFTFDHVACEAINQEKLFRVAGLPMVENCISGYNSCMFAYGQTGSGKTYTMLGEIDEMDIKANPHRGMTPRIFEFLFARIRAEEESRRDEKLKYSCQCSFLEIYNEQITDLLDPSSTNLLLREDIQKGVYVENLSEFEVETVNDVLKLLIQGSANRKVAATNMNRESSRSHSVFTCVIKSRWEKESTNMRFARLNLVDLAGSERQKTSGAEGERLKEAANINKSLSTLGHVIMILVDVAHGKPRHVPYRDSRLTFLLQDSLGGNSKTLIIANVSPSVCCATETLSTLKFAQRAKLVQNNAFVNEDATGDTIALQHQIRLLKEELSMLKRQNVSRSLSFRSALIRNSDEECASPAEGRSTVSSQEDGGDLNGYEALAGVRVSNKQLKSLEAILAGALRREKMADTTIKQLEAEIEQLNRLVRQRVEDTQHTKMMLKFREDKIQRINSVMDGLMPLESYLLEEKNSQAKEIQVLQAKVDRNPEVTRFALENIRLLDQLRRFQDFYEEGEKELLLTEVADLRDQLVQILDGKSQIDDRHLNLFKESQGVAYAEFVTSIKDDGSLQIELKQTRQELEDCRNNLKSSLEINAKLDREIDDLRSQLNNLQPLCRDIYPCAELQDMDLCSEGSSKVTPGEEKKAEYIDDTCKKLAEVEEILNLQLELDILKTILGEERVYRSEVEQRAFQLSNKLVMAEESFVLVNKKYEDAKTELADARSVIEALESHHITLINEMEDLKGKNNLNLELLRKQGLEISNLKNEHPIHFEDAENQSYMHLELKNQPLCSENSESPLQVKLKRMQASLEKARILNMRYQTDHESQTSHEQEMDDVRKQVEAETAEVIVCLQEELDTLQQLVNASSRNEFLAKQSLMALETEMKELQDRLYLVNQDNKQLSELVDEKDVELRVLTEEWEKLENDIAAVLVEGNMALEDASDQVVSINNSFPQRNWIGEQVGRIVKTISEKDLLIEELHSGLEDAQKVRGDMEWKLRSLRGATLAITEAQQQENRDKEQEIFQLTLELSEKLSTISELEKSLRLGEDQIRKAELCASGALMAVNRLSEIKSVHLDELKGKVIQLNLSIFHKDALLQDQISINADSEKQIQSLKVQLKESEDKVSQLQLDLAKEKEHIHTTECLFEKVKQNVAISRFAEELLETKEKLNHLKMGVSTLNSSIIQYTENVGEPAKEHTLTKEAFANVDDDYEDRTDVESTKGIREKEKHDVHQVTCFHTYDSAGKNSYICTLCNGKFDPCQQKLECGRSAIDVYDNNTTILLRKEIEAALDSLKGVQSQMHKLLEEREDIKKSEMQSRKCIEHLTGQVLRMEMEFNVQEKQLEFRILELDHKMEAIEGKARESIVCWHGAKENLEQEVRDAKVIAAQKTVEASNFLARFEEAQETMREADCMVNVLMAANEAAKLEIKRHLESEATLISERDILIHEVHSLHSSIDTHKQEYKNLEKKFLSDMSELRSFTLELENCFGHVQTTFVEEFKLIVCDIHCFKSELLQTAVLLRTWLEDIWSDIIMKDCSMCVLHLCHMGILLEAITGLNAENGLLHFGLCESNSIIAGLREHNVKARNELEICSIVKGKLLVDINNSFSRITRKENESEELRAKFSSLEKKIVELQLQEDLMLARANSMGSDLAVLMKDLDTNHINVLLDLSSKEFELFILKSELTQKFLKSKQVAVHIKNFEQQANAHVVLIEKIKNETFLLKINGELDKQLMMDMEAEIALLKGEVKESYIQLAIANNGTNSIVLKLNQSNEKIAEMENKMRTLEQDYNHISLKEMELKDQLSRQEIILNEKTMELKEVEQSREEVFKVVNTKNKEVQDLLERMDAMSNENSALNCDLEEATEELGRLSTLAELLQNENHRILENLQVKEAALESSSSGMVALQGENEELKNEVLRLKSEDSIAMEHSQEKRVEVMSSMFIPHYDQENHKLQDMICSLQARISSLQNELGMKKADSNELRCSHSVYSNELHLKAEGNEIQFDKVNAFKSENNALRHEIISLNQMKDETIAWLFLNQKNCSDSIKLVNLIANRVFLLFDVNCVKLIDKMCSEIDECEQRTSKFIEELELFDLYAKELFSENISLRSELMRKEEVTKGLLFDLSLLQESASIAKDQKDEIEELEAALESLEDELASRSSELDVAVAHGQMLEAHLFEKTNLISTLQFELAKEHESLKLVCGENIELKAHMEDILMKKNSAKQDLAERNELIERLEMELLEVRTLLDHKEHFLIDLQNDVTKLAEQRDSLISEVLILKEELEMAHALAEENEAIATEARQIAESRRSYAEDKEEEVKLLETSVQELECTVNVLENKVEIIKGEAERQRLQREEIEMELQEVRKQMLTACHSGKFENVTESGKVDFLREIEQKVSELQEVEKKLQILEKDVAEKDAEIVQCKAHIFELNMHAEAQTQENKLKINELETMVQQVKIDSLASNAASLPSTKSEKSSAKSRGSGSPFKCIGLGLTQQINSEKDEELTAGRRRIEELEALAASRQKEIFMLNSRLAKAESMTHDVLRDLLGVKLDMTNYAFLLDHQQVHKMTETAHHQCEGFQVKEQEINKLKIQLNEFIEERQGWLDETNRRHSELVTAQIELEKLRQRDQILTTENEILQVDNMKHKKMIMELEDEMKQLSSQQNLQQRIHHHVKIKEDNNMLRVLNKDLNAKLQQSEEVLSRLKEELAHYRTCIGKSPYNDIDEEQHLRNKLEDTEEERVQLTQKLLSLCTNILKAAGITQSSSTIISPSEAEDALNRLKNRADSLEKELQDLKFKRKISSEKMRLAELRQQQSSSLYSRADENCPPTRSILLSPNHSISLR